MCHAGATSYELVRGDAERNILLLRLLLGGAPLQRSSLCHDALCFARSAEAAAASAAGEQEGEEDEAEAERQKHCECRSEVLDGFAGARGLSVDGYREGECVGVREIRSLKRERDGRAHTEVQAEGWRRRDSTRRDKRAEGSYTSGK